MDVARRSVLASSLVLPLAGSAGAVGEQTSAIKGNDVTNFGMRAGNGDAHTNTLAFQDAFRGASIADGDQEYHKQIYIPAGRYAVNSITFNTGKNGNRLSVLGDGMGNTILEFWNPTGDAISIAGSTVSISNLTITSSPDRQAHGSGNGINLRGALQNTTQGVIQLTNVQIDKQPGDGVLAVSPELHRYDNVISTENTGAGSPLDWQAWRHQQSNDLGARYEEWPRGYSFRREPFQFIATNAAMFG